MSGFPSQVLLCLLAAGPALPNSCAPVEHDPITAADLAPLLPAFARLAPSTPVAAAPGPGVRRVFRALELQSFARTHSLDLPTAEELCFEWPMEVPDRAHVLEAMQSALPFPDAHIEIIEISPYPAPHGRIEFRREDLGAPALPGAPAPVVWRGNVLFNGSQRFAIWVRARVTARVPRLVAAELIRRGVPIAPSQVRIESNDSFPGPDDLAAAPHQVEGRIALRNISPGAAIHLSQLQAPFDVKRGEVVEVEARNGPARVSLTAKAETAGRTGDLITVRNLHSNRIFQARVAGKDKVFVDLGRAARSAPNEDSL